jgi:hypothetical protein
MHALHMQAHVKHVILEKSHVKSARVRQLGTILQADRPNGDGEVRGCTDGGLL